MMLTVPDEARAHLLVRCGRNKTPGVCLPVRRGYGGEKALEQTADPWSTPVTRNVSKASTTTRYFSQNHARNQQTERG